MREPRYLFSLDSSTTAEEGGPYAADVATLWDGVVRTMSARWLVGNDYVEMDSVSQFGGEPGYKIEAGSETHWVAAYDVANITDMEDLL